MYEYLTQIEDDIPSAKQLNEMNEKGWELVQIIAYAGGMNLAPGQFAVYFRRMKNGGH